MQAIRVAPVGARMPLSVGASSKVLVAYADPLVQREEFDHLALFVQLDQPYLVDVGFSITRAPLIRPVLSQSSIPSHERLLSSYALVTNNR